MKTTNLSDLVVYLQKQPYKTRVKILWGSIVVVAIILFGLWVLSLKTTIKSLDSKDVQPPGATSGINTTQVNYASIERIEAGSDSLKIYFNFNNTTDDIFNVSTLVNVKLTVDGKSISPSQMTNRQGQSFAQKILSHTQIFGILIFPKINAKTAGLIFDKMFFEQSPERTLSQKFDLDLIKLQKSDNLRN